MLSKLICAIALTSGSAVVQGHTVFKREAGYVKVNRDGGGGGHSHSHSPSASSSSGGSQYGAPQAPANSYSAPAPSYSAPAPSYSAPAPSYSAPEPSYSAPAPSYGAPEPSYGAPTTTYGEEPAGLDLTSILIPLLALIGLSLLFPTYVSLTSVRKRRDADDSDSAANPMSDVVERVNDIYLSVVESEECMQRIACEIGGLAGDVGLKENSIAKMADPFVPGKYKAYYQQFKSGQNCHKIKCGSIF